MKKAENKSSKELMYELVSLTKERNELTPKLKVLQRKLPFENEERRAAWDQWITIDNRIKEIEKIIK